MTHVSKFDLVRRRSASGGREVNVYEQDKEWNVEPIRSKQPARPPVALDRLVVPALLWIAIATFFAAVMVSRGGSPRWVVAALGVACSIPYGVFIWALWPDRHNPGGLRTAYPEE